MQSRATLCAAGYARRVTRRSQRTCTSSPRSWKGKEPPNARPARLARPATRRTLAASTLLKFLSTVTTRSVTAALSRYAPVAAPHDCSCTRARGRGQHSQSTTCTSTCRLRPRGCVLDVRTRLFGDRRTWARTAPLNAPHAWRSMSLALHHVSRAGRRPATRLTTREECQRPRGRPLQEKLSLIFLTAHISAVCPPAREHRAEACVPSGEARRTMSGSQNAAAVIEQARRCLTPTGGTLAPTYWSCSRAGEGRDGERVLAGALSVLSGEGKLAHTDTACLHRSSSRCVCACGDARESGH